MANGYDSSSMYDVGNAQGQNGLIGEGDAGMQVLQREMLRRAQFAQQAQEQARQAELDRQNEELRQAKLANEKENLASTIQTRQSQAQDIADRQDEREYKILTSQMKPGDIPQAQYNKASKNPLLSGMLRIVPSKPAVPGSAAVPAPIDPDSGLPTDNTLDVAAVPAQPEQPQSYSYAGTPEQQATAEHDANIKRAAAGEFKKDPRYGKDAAFTKAADYLEQEAALADMGIKGKDQLAAVMKDSKAKEAGTEAQQRGVLMSHLIQQNLDKGMDQVAAETAATKQMYALGGEQADKRQLITVNTGEKRQDSTQLIHEYDRVGTELTKMTDASREKLAEATKVIGLVHSGGVGQSTAIPAFLSMEVAGMGKGFRMTKAEIDQIQQSAPLLAQAIRKAGNFFSVDDYKSLTNKQMEDMTGLAMVIANREIARGQMLNAAGDDYLEHYSNNNLKGLLQRQRQLSRELNDFGVGELNTASGKKDAAPGAKPAVNGAKPPRQFKATVG